MTQSTKLFTILIGLLSLSSCMKSIDCDLVIHNAKIYSLNGSNEVFEAMAIKDGKILELGAERQILNKYSYDDSYDAQLQVIFPGFIDAHCHFLGYGLSLQQAELKSCNSFNEVLEKLKLFNEKKIGDWIVGRGWDATKWRSNTFPNKAGLDSLFPDIPAFIRRIDGHAALANQKALDIGGITVNTQVAGGHVEVLNGKLTGILVDNAKDLISMHIPAPSQDEKKKALMTAQKDCFQVGLTTIDDAGLSKSDIEIIQGLQKSGLLKMRIYAMISADEENLNHYLKVGPIKTDRLNVRSFKFYGDGALGSRGACLLRPYDDDPENLGFLVNEEEHFRRWAKKIYNAGFQMNTHCIGDSAARLIMNIYGEVLKGQNDKRWRIEHAQIINSNDVELFRKYSI
ncbi:MAG: amidohydrolase family protein, partial [Flavobacteriales bacterium]|nr:amidohydrolase family protein [Flavobacteriales bacterium]